MYLTNPTKFNIINSESVERPTDKKTLNDLIHRRGKLITLWKLLEFMKQFDITKIFSILTLLDSNVQITYGEAYERIGHENDFYKAHDEFIRFAQTINCDVSKYFAGAALSHVELNPVSMEGEDNPDRPLTPDEMVKCEQLRQKRLGMVSSFLIEASRHKFYCMGEMVHLYENSTNGWEEIINKWPGSEDDIAQASKCLALEQWTACVFHLARVSEMVLREVCAQENIPHNGKVQMMGNYIKDIELFIKQSEHPAKKEELSRILSIMQNISQGWRNPTMHPGVQYKDFEARAAYDAVRNGLMVCANL